MAEITLVQNGSEVARHDRADVADWFKRLVADRLACSDVSVFTDDTVGHLLGGLKPDDCNCLVFASNALLSGAVTRSVINHSDDLRRYIGSGGGIVILHQLIDSLTPLLPEEWVLDIQDRVFGDVLDAKASPFDNRDVLLNYPLPVDLPPLADNAQRAGPRPLYWKAIKHSKLNEMYKPVLLGGNDEVLVARTISQTRAKVVVSTIPADWQRCDDLVVNAVAYALHGKPLRALCRPDGKAQDEILEQWLCDDGRTATVDVPSSVSGDRDPRLEWLLSEIDLCVVPKSGIVDPVPERAHFKKFVEAGGAIVEVSPQTEDGVRKIQAVVGGHLEAHLVRQFFVELEAVPDWESPTYAFELRNIVSLLDLLWPDYRHRSKPLALDPGELTRLEAEVRSRLAAHEHREDFGSCVALGQTLRFLTRDGTCFGDLSWMEEALRSEARDVQFQAKAVLVAAREDYDPNWLAELTEAWDKAEGEFASLASVARILDAVSFLTRFDRLKDLRSLHLLAELICDKLDEEELQAGSGWLSIEATADIVRGLIAILEAGGADDKLRRRLVTHIAVGSSFLRRALPRYERNARGLGWLACLTEALVLVDRSYPLGVGRLLTLDWPREAADEEAADGGGEKTLIATLAQGNRRKRDLERQLARDRLATTLGRWTATLAGVAAIPVIVVPGLELIDRMSVPDILSLFMGGLVLLFSLVPLALVERLGLLAPQIEKPYRWLRDLVQTKFGPSR